MSVFVNFSVQAAPQSGGIVERLYIHKSGLVLFRLGKSSDLPESCSDITWPYQFNTTDTIGKEWLSLLLTAKSKGESLNIGYIPQAGTTRCKIEYLYQ
tara:strand:+ start:1527 stop:1820 length:294 start_codon:yes stop_codon:yes gene_type:complete